jgi:hypothetical protein
VIRISACDKGGLKLAPTKPLAVFGPNTSLPHLVLKCTKNVLQWEEGTLGHTCV